MRISWAHGVLWAGFFGAVVIAWTTLWIMAQDRATFSDVYGLELLATLCQADAAGIGFLPLWAMWAVMAAAMMAPTAAPAFGTWLALPNGGAGSFVVLVGGYLAVWGGAAAGFAALQSGLAWLGVVAPDGQSVTPLLTAGLLVLAGGYQFSSLRMACLAQCRHPLTFFLAHWRPGLAGAFRLGLRLGALCLGCCWALMALAFVGGMANLLWMGLAMLLMVVEKVDNLGRHLTRPLGWGLILGSILSLTLAIGELT